MIVLARDQQVPVLEVIGFLSIMVLKEVASIPPTFPEPIPEFLEEMARGIGKIDRAITDIGKPIEALRI